MRYHGENEAGDRRTVGFIGRLAICVGIYRAKTPQQSTDFHNPTISHFPHYEHNTPRYVPGGDSNFSVDFHTSLWYNVSTV